MTEQAVAIRNIMSSAWLRSRVRWYGAIAAATILSGMVPAANLIAAEPVGPGLTGKLRELLVMEMVEIESAMRDRYGAIFRGNHATVARKGQAIHDSFILEQSLTEQDLLDLEAAVPEDFLQMDQRFHELAALLAEAGKLQDTRKQVEVFNSMTKSCVVCHSRYATDRFSGLQDQPVAEALPRVIDDP